MTLLDALPAEATLRNAVVAAVTRAAAHNPNDAVAPAVILWTDKERQWEGLLPEVRRHLPLLTLGAYAPEVRSGPALWLRCAIAGVLDPAPVPVGVTPVIYLPGVSRGDLRAVESCPKDLQPLAELQYRGVFWSHSNGRDWTVAGFLQSPNGGLGIPVQGGAETDDALRMGLEILSREPLQSLKRAAPLNAAYVHELLTPDPGRLLLRWLNDSEGTRAALSAEAWSAFLAVCRDLYGFRPEQDGPITGARKLGQRKGHWAKVWDLFKEQAERYPGVITLLANEKPAQLSLFDEPPFGGDEDSRSPWPRENERTEAALQQDLQTLVGMTAVAARARVRELEVHHAGRRQWVWAKLGQAPLALALKHLADLATRTAAPVAGLSTADIVSLYAESGWRTDIALLRALAATARMAPDDEAAVRTAVTALYRDWLEGAATALQQAVTGDALDYPADPVPGGVEGTCLLFVDGLRFDLGMALGEQLRAKGLEPSVVPRLAALPPVTSTAKPAVSPVARLLTGNGGLETRVAPDGPKVNATVLHKQLADAGYQVLRGDEAGDPAGRAWTEQGEIDKYGHNHGLRVAEHGLQEVERLVQRIGYLLAAGWQEVIVVTDHGWLLLPGGLPTASLPEHLTEVRKGRCARLKEGAAADDMTVLWHWNPAVRIAVAPGIRCYEAGKVYEHGGLSPQECVTPVITVRKTAATAAGVEITQAAWRGLRCRIAVTGANKAMTVDLRTSAADPASSVADTPKTPDPDGTTTIFLHGDRDDLVGIAAWIVVTGQDGALLAQQQTVIGE